MARQSKAVYQNNLAKEKSAEWMADLKKRYPLASENELVWYALEEYKAFKRENFKVLKDYGAIGDLIEIVIVCALRLSGFRLLDLHTKASGKFDFVSKGKTYEIGHNGKSFNFDLPIDREYVVNNVDFVSADFFVYGIVSNNVDTDEIEKSMFVFTNEQAYEMFLYIGGKKGVTKLFNLTKGGKSLTIQQSNAIEKRFAEYVKNNSIPSVREYAYKRIAENK